MKTTKPNGSKKQKQPTDLGLPTEITRSYWTNMRKKNKGNDIYDNTR